MKLKTVTHSAFPTPQGVVVFTHDIPNFVELDNFGHSVFSAFNLNPTDSSEVIKLARSKRKTTITISQLVATGLLVEDNSPQSRPPQVELNVKAFRIVLTESCNLGCGGCFVNQGDKANLRTMKSETLQELIAKIVPFGVNQQVTLHFFGGEPLVSFDLIRKAVTLIHQAVEKGQMLDPIFMITTNLTLLNDEICRFFGMHQFRVGVSIDGDRDINDRFRPFKNGTGTFSTVKQNYQKLVDEGINTHVLITPHDDSLAFLPEIVEWILRDFPMETITINTPLKYSSVGWDVEGGSFARLLIESIARARVFGVEVDSALASPLAAISEQRVRLSPCVIDNSNVMVSVSPDGGFSFCPQNWDITHEELSRNGGFEVKHSLECSVCNARSVCGGPCPIFQQKTGKLVDQNKCAFMKSLPGLIAENLDLFE